MVEKVDENAFHRKHMFQIVVVPSGPVYSPDTPSQMTLYLQAAVSVRKKIIAIGLNLVYTCRAHKCARCTCTILY